MADTTASQDNTTIIVSVVISALLAALIWFAQRRYEQYEERIKYIAQGAQDSLEILWKIHFHLNTFRLNMSKLVSIKEGKLSMDISLVSQNINSTYDSFKAPFFPPGHTLSPKAAGMSDTAAAPPGAGALSPSIIGAGHVRMPHSHGTPLHGTPPHGPPVGLHVDVPESDDVIINVASNLEELDIVAPPGGASAMVQTIEILRKHLKMVPLYDKYVLDDLVELQNYLDLKLYILKPSPKEIKIYNRLKLYIQQYKFFRDAGLDIIPTKEHGCEFPSEIFQMIEDQISVKTTLHNSLMDKLGISAFSLKNCFWCKRNESGSK
jgi:hypothetical protein